MRFAVIFLLVISGSTGVAQPDLWAGVKPHFDLPQLTPASLSDSRLAALRGLLREHRRSLGWDCGGQQFEAMLKGLIIESIPLSRSHQVVLAEASSGCARGGQGSNGAMWLVRFDGDTPFLMSTPKDGLNGWLFSIQAEESHGYHDFILGWHMGAMEGSLNYFRFDGKSYRNVGSAGYRSDDGDNLKITPYAK